MRPLGAYNPLGPTERRYVLGTPHQDLRGPGGVLITPGQGTMRAHHIADHEIQQMICDYMNGTINMITLFDRIGALYLTSWIDVIVTPRLFKIWLQWAAALAKTLRVMMSYVMGLAPARQALYATFLSNTLSSSVANLRVGHQRTDAALGHAIAPRLQRGQYDLMGYFIGWLTGHNFAQPTLSVETSLAVTSWGGHFIGNPLAPGGRLVVVGNTFIGPGALPNSILISEQDPVPPAMTSTMAMPSQYPGASGRGGYVLRATRSTIHLAVTLMVLGALGYKGKELIWPRLLALWAGRH